MLKIFDYFSPRANAADANYPNGSVSDRSAPGMDDGTPLAAILENDFVGFSEALIAFAAIVASGNADTVIASDRFDALIRMVYGVEFDIADTETCAIGKINKPDNSDGAITVLLPTTGLYVGATVLFTGNPVVLYHDNPVTFDGDGNNIGKLAVETEAVLEDDGFCGGFRWDGTVWIPIKIFATGLER